MPKVMTMGGLNDCGCSSAPSSATGVSGSRRRRHKGRRAGSFKGVGKITNPPPGLTRAHRPRGFGNAKYDCRKVRGKWYCEEKPKKRRRRH